jgi:GNAT superfamily N-acetyltransferase
MTGLPGGISDVLPVIRPSDRNDHSAVCDMDRRGRSKLVGTRGGDAWLAEHPPIDEHLNASGFRILVAELSGAVVGFSSSFDTDERERGRVCFVDRIFVDEGAREIGCGDALLAEEISRALARECALIEAHALPGDRETKNLYERAGITARLITVSKRLSGPSIGEPASR